MKKIMITLLGLFEFVFILISTLLFFLDVHASPESWENLVNRLTKTRSEIESLSREMDSLQKEKQSELDQLVMRKSDLDTQVEREKLRKLQLTEKLRRLEGRVRVIGKTDPEAQKKLQSWITEMRVSVKDSIPYQRDLRLQNLVRLEDRIKKNHEPIEFIMSDFWSFIEAEFKLAQTNEYQIVSLDFEGQKKKCEVARLGLMSMFAVTADGNIRQAVKFEKDWQWKNIESSVEQNSILSLVKNLKNKNSTEIYQLPIAVTKGVSFESSQKASGKSATKSDVKSENEGVRL